MMPEETETKLQMTEEDCRKIVRLMKRTPRRSFLRQVISGKTGAISPTPGTIRELCALLNETNETRWRERSIAAIAFRYAPIAPDERGIVAQALGRALQTRYARRLAKASLFFLACFSAGLLALLTAFLMVFDRDPIDPNGGYFVDLGLVFLSASPLVLFVPPLLDSIRNRGVQAVAVETLARLQLPESVGALAKAAQGENHCAQIAASGLKRLLPTLNEAYYGHLWSDATPELCALLTYCFSEKPFAEAVLTALGKVGDGRAVEPAQKFAQYVQTPELRQQAQSILPILIARREQENASSILLRHSSAPPVAASELLRAASVSAVTPSALLLRPAAGTEAAPGAEN